MNLFKVKFEKLINLLLPTFLRKKRLQAFLLAAIQPLREVYNQFEKQRKDAELLLKYDTSKRNLELALKAKFGDGIYIQNVEKKAGLHLDFYLPAYTEQAGYQTQIETAYLPQYLNFYLDERIKTDDFTIYVPQTKYDTSAQEITNFAGFFILPAMNYTVAKY